jgi:hypothetical protein
VAAGPSHVISQFSDFFFQFVLDFKFHVVFVATLMLTLIHDFAEVNLIYTNIIISK